MMTTSAIGGSRESYIINVKERAKDGPLDLLIEQ